MMRSATAFLPPSMITFMNFDSSTLPYLGSGRISRLGTSRRRGISNLFASVGTVSGTARVDGNSHLLDPTAGHYARQARQGRRTPLNDRRPQAFLGRLAPYLERACLRSFTPCR